MTRFNKTWVALAGTLAMLLHGALADGTMTPLDWATFATQAVCAILVLYVDNTGGAPYAKAVAAFGMAAAATFMVVFADLAITGDDVWKIVISGINAVLVLAVKNFPSPDRPSTPVTPGSGTVTG